MTDGVSIAKDGKHRSTVLLLGRLRHPGQATAQVRPRPMACVSSVEPCSRYRPWDTGWVPQDSLPRVTRSFFFSFFLLYLPTSTVNPVSRARLQGDSTGVRSVRGKCLDRAPRAPVASEEPPAAPCTGFIAVTKCSDLENFRNLPRKSNFRCSLTPRFCRDSVGLPSPFISISRPLQNSRSEHTLRSDRKMMMGPDYVPSENDADSSREKSAGQILGRLVISPGKERGKC